MYRFVAKKGTFKPLPYVITEEGFETEDKDVADFIRSFPEFGSEYFEVSNTKKIESDILQMAKKIVNSGEAVVDSVVMGLESDELKAVEENRLALEADKKADEDARAIQDAKNADFTAKRKAATSKRKPTTKKK